VVKTRVGFSGGSTPNPTYRTIGDHTETVDIEFDTTKTNYETLLNNFWKWHNPTVGHNRQYMSAIFYHTEEQRELAEKTKKLQQEHMARPIVTLITKALPFYDAEDYHQKYQLRQYHYVLDALKLTDAELIQSNTACRLNGYLGGYGKVEDFSEESESLGISEAVKNYVVKQIEKRRR